MSPLAVISSNDPWKDSQFQVNALNGLWERKEGQNSKYEGVLNAKVKGEGAVPTNLIYVDDDGLVHIVEACPTNVSVVEVIDCSGSMSGDKLSAAKAAAGLFVGLMGQGDKIGIVSYASSATVNFPLIQIIYGSNVQSEATSAINQITEWGFTSIGAGVQVADTQLDRFPNDPVRVMIVMTDGEQNEDPEPIGIINTQVDDNIRIFTIGFGADAGESLLIQMAGLRNGQYWKATEVDLNKVYSLLYGSLGGAQQIYNSSDKIQAGQQINKSVTVDPSATQLTVGINWGGSNLDLELIAPDGTVITHSTPATNPDVQLVEESTYEFYKIMLPLPGAWGMRVLGVDVPQVEEDYNLYAMVDSAITADIYTDKSSYLTGELVNLKITLNDGRPIVGALAVAYVTPPAGALYDNARVMLYDDGLHNDDAANDGIYGGVFRRVCWAGQYRIDLVVHGLSNAGFEFDSAPTTSIVVTASPDSDSDGIPDMWEDREGTNKSVNDATTDLDLDALPNIQEFYQGTMPGNKDTDGDKSPDGLEITLGTDPLDPNSFINPLTVIINQALGQSDPTKKSSIHFTVVFSEPVRDFTASDVTLSGTAGAGAVSVIPAGREGTTYYVAISGMAGSGTVIASIAEGVAHDAEGNPNAASPSGDNSVTYISYRPPTFRLTGPTKGTYAPGQSVTITWRAGNVSSNSVISLCLDRDKKWNGNEKWIEIGQVCAANGCGSYAIDPANFMPGRYFIGGYMWDGGHKFILSHLTKPIIIPAPTFKLTGPTSGIYTPGQSVTITWTACNVSCNSVISLCLDRDKKWNGNERWIEIDQVAAANGHGSYNIDTTDLIPGKYYIGGYIYDKILKTATFSRLSPPISFTTNLFLLKDKKKELSAIDLILRNQDTWIERPSNEIPRL